MKHSIRPGCGSEIEKNWDGPELTLLPNAHSLKVPGKTEKYTCWGLILEYIPTLLIFLVGLFLLRLRYIWIIRIHRYLCYLKNTFWNRTSYHAFRFILEDNRTGIEPGVEEKEVEENSWWKFCQRLILLLLNIYRYIDIDIDRFWFVFLFLFFPSTDIL
jgi:hypothetical protein